MGSREDIPGRGSSGNMTEQESVGHGVGVGASSEKPIWLCPGDE